MYKKNPDKASMRDFLNAVIEGKVDDEAIDFAKAEIAKLDARNAKRAGAPSKTAVANEPIKKSIMDFLTDEPKTASDVATAINVSTQKASALLRQMVADEKITSVELKVKGKGKCKGYSRAD